LLKAGKIMSFRRLFMRMKKIKSSQRKQMIKWEIQVKFKTKIPQMRLTLVKT